MQEQEPLTPADRELQEALGRLRPADISIDQERLIFRAGQLSVRRSVWRWRAIAAVLVAGLGLSLAVRPEAQSIDQLTYVDAYQQPAERLVNEYSYLRLQRKVLAEGLDALPAGRTHVGHMPADEINLYELTDWRKRS